MRSEVYWKPLVSKDVSLDNFIERAMSLFYEEFTWKMLTYVAGVRAFVALRRFKKNAFIASVAHYF